MKIPTFIFLTLASILSLSHVSPGRTIKADDGQEFLVATQRNGRLHFFKAETLEPLGYFVLNKGAHNVSSSPDGGRLFIAQPAPPDDSNCCALFSLDLTTRQLCKLVFPTGEGVLSPNGRWIFAQRGNVGIEVFDPKTLARLPTIKAPGLYQFQPSPDSRWMFGATSFQLGHGPSLDLFDLESMSLVRRLPVPTDRFPQVVRLNSEYYLYADQDDGGNLWKVSPETTTLGSPVKIALPKQSGDERPILHTLIAGGAQLFLFEGFGYKGSRTGRSGRPIPGGIFSMEPSSGKIIAHLAPTMHFARVRASADGQWIYGFDLGALDWKSPLRLVKLDASNGEVVAERELEGDVWSFDLARLPISVVPKEEVQTKPCGTGASDR